MFQISQIIRKFIYNNAYSDQSVTYFANNIDANGENNSLHNNGVIDLLKALEKNTVVQKLIIKFLYLDDEIVIALSNFVAVNKSVVKIYFDLIGGNLTEDACNIFATKLQHNNCLQDVGIFTSIEVMPCNVNDFIVAICNGLCENRSLQKLSFVGNKSSTHINLECAKSTVFIPLCLGYWDENMLKYMTVLATSLVQIFKSNPSLRSITLDLPMESYYFTLPKILEAIKDNRSLVDFTLCEHSRFHGSYDDYNDKIAIAIADVLLTNKNVKKICLSEGIKFSFNGWTKVLKALHTHLAIDHFTVGRIGSCNSVGLALHNLQDEVNANRKKNLNFCWRIFYENIGGYVGSKLKRFFKRRAAL
jgi:hypothetical protein